MAWGADWHRDRGVVVMVVVFRFGQQFRLTGAGVVVLQVDHTMPVLHTA